MVLHVSLSSSGFAIQNCSRHGPNGFRANGLEQPQACSDSLLYRIDDRTKNLVRDDFVGVSSQTLVQGLSPRHAQFSINVDDVDSRGNRLAEVFVIRSGSAVQREKDSGGLLDLGNS